MERVNDNKVPKPIRLLDNTWNTWLEHANDNNRLPQWIRRISWVVVWFFMGMLIGIIMGLLFGIGTS